MALLTSIVGAAGFLGGGAAFVRLRKRPRLERIALAVMVACACVMAVGAAMVAALFTDGGREIVHRAYFEVDDWRPVVERGRALLAQPAPRSSDEWRVARDERGNVWAWAYGTGGIGSSDAIVLWRGAAPDLDPRATVWHREADWCYLYGGTQRLPDASASAMAR